MQVDSDSLGGYLRLERERRHVSLQDISAATKIQLKFLEALERDDYDRLPPTPFVVGFLRAYAQYLALDAESILAAYRAIYLVPEEPESAQPLVIYPARRAKRLGTIGVGILVIVLGVTVSAVLREWGPPWPLGTQGTTELLPSQQAAEPLKTASQPPQTSPEQGTAGKKAAPIATTPAEVNAHSTPGGTTPTVPSSPAVSSARGESGQGQHPEPPRPDVNTALVLQAQALTDTWLRVEIDGDKRLELLLVSGKSMSWEATARFSLTVGNARGIRLTLNGQEMSLPQTRSNVVRDFLLTRAQLN